MDKKKFLFFLTGCLLFLPILTYGEENIKHVLVLNSYHPEYDWTRNISAGINQAFNDSNIKVRLHFDYMDTRRNRSSAYRASLETLLNEKHQDKNYDIVIGADNNALSYLLANRHTLSGNPPVIFCGINNYNSNMLNGHQNITGVAELPSTFETLDLALDFHPDLSEFIVLGSTQSLSSRLNLERIKHAAEKLNTEIPFTYYIDRDIDTLKQALNSLKAHQAVILSGIIYDRVGHPLDFKDRTKFIKKNTLAPIYSFWEHCMGNGIVGGKLVSARQQGFLAASMAIQALGGKPLDQINVIGEKANTWQFDYKELERFGLSVSDLPAGSIIINMPAHFIKRYKYYIAGVLVIGIQLLIILALYSNKSRLRKTVHDQTAILDNVPAYIYFKDDKNNILQVSESVARITGLPRHEIEGRHSSEVYPETADRYYEDDLEVIRSGKPKEGILEPLPLADGETRWLLTDKIPYRENEGQVEGIIVMATDITERVEIENKLRTSETKFRSLFEYAADAIYLVSEQGRFLEVNKTAEVQTGYSREQLLKMHVGDLDARAAEENDDTQIWKKLSPGQTHALKTEHRHKDGHLFPVEINISIIGLDEERILLGFVRDVTDKEKTLQELKQSEERLSLAFQGANDGLWDWNLETDEIFYSPRWKNMLGYEDDEIKNQFSEWERLVIPDDRERAWRTMNDYLQGNRENFTCEFRMRHKNGGVVDILSRAFAIRRESDHKPIRVIGTHVEITERKEMQRRLQQAQKMESIGSLAGGIAHDFNNILSPIIGMSELLLEDLPSGGIEHENVEEIYKAGKRGSDLVKQILAFSRQSEKTRVPTRLQNILYEVLKLCRASIPINIEILHDVQDDCGLVLADPTQIHQVGMNMITNAYHAVENDGGKITVRLEQRKLAPWELAETDLEPGRYAVLAISDTGHGILPENIDKIFDPYFTTKEKGKGTGLGLAVVYGIIREHKGDIIVRSELGKGTGFTIVFPLMTKTVQIEQNRFIGSSQTGNERILLVDDEEPIIKIETQALERLGYDVTSRLNSIEALNAFKSDPSTFDLVISDVTMPNMTGDELALELISIRNDIPVILCTGFSERIDKEKAALIGVKGFLMKPVIGTELAKTVRKVLDDGGVKTHSD